MIAAAIALLVSGSVVAGVVTENPGTREADRPLAQGQPGSFEVIPGEPGVPTAVLVSRTFFTESATVVLVSARAGRAQQELAGRLGVARKIPVFTVGRDTTAAVAAELRRLKTGTAFVVGTVPGIRIPMTEVDRTWVDGDPPPAGPAQVVALIAADGGDVASASATAAAAGAQAVVVPVADPRANGEAADVLKANPDAAVRAFGSGFGTSEQLAERVGEARALAQLPGGGRLVFPGRRMVALYGTPGSHDLGPLGRQSLAETITRVRRLAATYEPYSDVPVIPAFEIIVTVASADPGYQGKYTNPIDIETIRPWVDAAREAGIYVTLDLQPGRMDFLTQAKMYQSLLLEPHVGLALDPEWRLRDDQVHLTQIGRVSPAEVNETSAWLAALVRDHDLPQKLLVLHQFDADMLGDRSRIVTTHPELQLVLHADGHGTPAVKMGTWRRMVAGMPDNTKMGWKNFYQEDHPMFTPEQTLAVRPEPWFISYQ